MKQDKNHSLLESVAYVTQEVFDNSRQYKRSRSNYKKFCELYPEDRHGLIERLNICIEWAKEFETLNAGREWDSEYYDEIIAFIDKKLNPKNDNV